MASTPHQAGSSFKPYVLTAGLESDPQQIGLNSVYDRSSPQTFHGPRVRNADGDNCPDPCTVKKAMTQSINTVFYTMGTPGRLACGADGGVPGRHPEDRTRTTSGTPVPSLVDDEREDTQAGHRRGWYRDRPVPGQRARTRRRATRRSPTTAVHPVALRAQGDRHQRPERALPVQHPREARVQLPTRQQAPRSPRRSSDSMTAGGPVEQASAWPTTGPADAKTGTQNFVAPDTTRQRLQLGRAGRSGSRRQVVTAVWFGHYDQPGPIFGNGNGLLRQPQTIRCSAATEPGAHLENYMNSYLQRPAGPAVPDIARRHPGQLRTS